MIGMGGRGVLRDVPSVGFFFFFFFFGFRV